MVRSILIKSDGANFTKAAGRSLTVLLCWNNRQGEREMERVIEKEGGMEK